MPDLLNEQNLMFKNESFNIIGAAMQVHTELKYGFSEAVYQEALEREFILRGIPYEREKLINIYYKGQKLDQYYKADFVCYEDIIVEVKALGDLTPRDTSQVINYLSGTKKPLGILLNFGTISLQRKRIINKLLINQ